MTRLIEVEKVGSPWPVGTHSTIFKIRRLFHCTAKSCQLMSGIADRITEKAYYDEIKSYITGGRSNKTCVGSHKAIPAAPSGTNQTTRKVHPPQRQFSIKLPASLPKKCPKSAYIFKRPQRATEKYNSGADSVGLELVMQVGKLADLWHITDKRQRFTAGLPEPAQGELVVETSKQTSPN